MTCRLTISIKHLAYLNCHNQNYFIDKHYRPICIHPLHSQHEEIACGNIAKYFIGVVHVYFNSLINQ